MRQQKEGRRADRRNPPAHAFGGEEVEAVLKGLQKEIRARKEIGSLEEKLTGIA